MFDTFTKFWEDVLGTKKVPTNPYFEAIEQLNPYQINYLDFGRQTGKTTFANSLEDTWVFSLYPNPRKSWAPQRLFNMVHNEECLRGLRAPKYLVLDEYTEQMLRNVLELYLKLQNPLYDPDKKKTYIIVLGNPLYKT